METFTNLKPLVDNPAYQENRTNNLKKLHLGDIDKPIRGIITALSDLSHCFTLQCCYGHFVHAKQKDIHNVEPLSNYDGVLEVEYRIAYIALCLENNVMGRQLFRNFKGLISVDPEYVQFGCADWFWTRQVNSFAVQVEPVRFKTKDKATLDFDEALHVEEVRNKCFDELNTIMFG